MRRFVAFAVLVLVFFSKVSFAGFCAPIDPYAAPVDVQICGMQTTRANCGGSCTWFREDGYPTPFCGTLQRGDTVMAPICNLYKTRELCNNNSQICRWGR
ncbi:MAG: hypothetical protein EOP06_25635 [Proteobacteria bacterium]|nr:MAG: hypothetical protein EOP06_25635 [Pseudomonadota bacterium]